MKTQKKENILSVDRGTKHIWLAYRNVRADMTMPIWSLVNDASLFFNMWWVLERYRIKSVVVGYPKQQKWLQKRIDAFLKQLTFLDDKLELIRTDEEYSSVQAGDILDNHKKNVWEDTVAAMVIMDNYLNWL